MDIQSEARSGRVTDYDEKIGQRLRDKRVSLGLSQQTLGKAVGVSIQQIQKYEKAKNRIAAGKLMQFASLLKAPITYFYDGLEESVMTKMKLGMAESQDEFSTSGVTEREIMSLVRSFNGISDISVRKHILDLVKSLSLGKKSIN